MIKIEPIQSKLDFKVLNPDQLAQIKAATLHVLEHVGVRFPSERALDVIEAVGPGGHYLSQKHTRAHMREIWIPDLTHPRPSANGSQNGDIRKRARAKFDKILAEHEPQPLEEAAIYEINSILMKAEAQLGR
jgi:trimethylamine:corrinoid methyltransferase-like protein